MKKIFAILLSAFILLAGMNFTIATHYCGGEIAEVKYSFSKEKASCGMEDDFVINLSSEYTIDNKCCKDKFDTFSVDSNYSPSSFQVKEVVKNISQTYAEPVNTINNTSNASNSSVSWYILPDIVFQNAVTLSEIRVFRI